MATYVNNLRLTELATGEGSGTWGTTTNTSLELIGEALGYNTQDCFSSDADATTTVADGATDPARAFYFKVTSSATLTATRTLTIAPNTISRVMFIENATTGSQSIAISQGSGANVTIATGKTAVVYLDGAGSGAAVVDAMANVDPGVTDTLAEVLAAGNTSGGTGLTMSSGDDLTLTGASYNVVWDSSDSALEFADNAKAIFGTGGDLEIYHNASNSYIDDAGTGGLVIRSSQVNIGKYTGETSAVFTADGSVQLRYDNSAKFETTSTGVDITGEIEADTAHFGTGTGTGTSVADEVVVSGTGSTGLTIHSPDASNATVSFGSATDNDYAFVQGFYNSGSPLLRFSIQGNERAKVTNSGIDVTGTAVVDGLTVDGTATITTSDNTAQLTLVSTDDDANVGPVLDLTRNSASPAADDGLGQIRFNGQDSGGNELSYAHMRAFIVDPTDGSEDGKFEIDVREAGGQRSRLLFDSTETAFNEESRDFDFRVESDGATHMLFVDAGNNRVGIGKSAPEVPLHLATSSSGTAVILESTDAGAADGPTLNLWRNSATPADGDGIGAILFQGEDDGGGRSTFGQIRVESSDVTAGSEDGLMSIRTTVNGSDTARINLKSSEAVFNEGSADIDFRVESNNNANMLFVDAGNDSVNIGDSDGSLATLQVRGEVGGSIFRLFSGTSYQGLQFKGTASLGNGTVEILPVTIPGSGTANQYTYFNSIASGGTTKHHVVVENSFQVDDGDAVFNQSGGNNDFRVESDTDAGLFFVDASTSRVGIGTQSPEALLDVRGSAHIQSSQDGDVQLRIENSNTGANSVAQLYLDGQGNNFYIKNYGDGTSTPNLTDLRSTAGSSEFAFSPASTETMRIKQNFVGINTDSPAIELDIARVSNSYQIRVGSETGSGKAMVFADIASTPTKYNFLVGSQYNHNDTWEVTPSTAVGGYTFSYSAITVDAAGFVTINENSRDSDFRVESDSNANMLFVDASGNQVGIGKNPSNTFDVNGSASFGTTSTNNSIVLNGQQDGTVIKFNAGGSHRFDLDCNGTGTDHLSFNETNATKIFTIYRSSTVVVNEDSLSSIDFRAESDSNANMLLVDASGNRVIIGRSFGSATLEIYEAANKDEADAHFRIVGNGYSGNHWLDGAAYYIGQNSTSRSLRFYSGAETAGAQLSSGATSFTTFSDERLKYDVEPIENALDSLSGLRTVKYRLEGVDSPSDKKKLGVIAQDLVGVHDEVLDPMVRSDDDTEYMGVRYTELVPVLIKAVQEQTEIINDLRARVAQLESN